MNILNQYLSVYTYEFFATDTKHQDLCRQVLDNAEQHAIVADSMRLILPFSKNSQSTEVIKNSLCHRLPVYFGQPMWDMFDRKVFETLTGCTLDQIQRVDPFTRYAICGKVLAIKEQQQYWTYISHVWGIDFESKSTHDYKHFMTRDGRVQRDIYAKAISDLVNIILHSGIHSMVDAKATKCHMLVPMVGMGAFLEEVSDNDKIWARKLYMSTFSRALTDNIYKGLVVHIFDTTGVAKKLPHLEHNRFKMQSNVDIFCAAAHMLGKTPCLCVVNSWDPVSWIGNGGSDDMSIDGMLVSGVGSGHKFPNSSYLHNTFLTPTILNESHWIYANPPVATGDKVVSQ